MYKTTKLKFRRQFLFSAKKCEKLNGWQFIDFSSQYLYVHPDCELNKVYSSNADLILIGHVINPSYPEKTSLQVLHDMSNFKKIDEIPEILFPLVGRFVLLIRQNNVFTFFNDPCGLKQLFYIKDGEDFYAASQPLLIKQVLNIEKSSNYDSYYQSDYVKNKVEHWLPTGVSLYKDVFHLTPNHFVDSFHAKQKRYWPNKPFDSKTLEDSVEKISFLVRNTMIAAKKRWPLAISLTAGYDTRTVLSSSKDIINGTLVYTLKYRNLNKESNDIKIPQKLSTRLGFQYQCIECEKTFELDFRDIYINNSDMSHFNDWGIIANGMYYLYPQDRVAVRGNCVEIGRCAYYRTGKHKEITSVNTFINSEPGWDKINFIKERVNEWYEEIKDSSVNLGYDLWDLFYWEHRVGSWQAQSQLEWDIVQDAFTPFNNREVIVAMLGVNPKFRRTPDFILFKKIIETNWKETLSEPINPQSLISKAKKNVKNMLFYYNVLNPTHTS